MAVIVRGPAHPAGPTRRRVSPGQPGVDEDEDAAVAKVIEAMSAAYAAYDDLVDRRGLIRS